MTQDKLRGALSLCRRAGALVCGTEAVKEALSRGNLRIVLLTQDTSPRTQRQMWFLCNKAALPCKILPADMDSLSSIFGKTYGVMGLCDENLQKLIEKYCLEDRSL